MNVTTHFLTLFLLLILLQVPLFSSPLPTSIQPPTHLWPSPHCCLCLCVMCMCPSANPFIFFHSVLPPSALTAVTLFSVSMSLFLFCLSVYFVHQIPHTEKIIWYLSCSDWLISLSIIVSRSIHAVAKGKISFFFYSFTKEYSTV